MKIIVVEDEERTRNGILNILEKYTDYQVTAVAENGQAGYELIREQKPDLIISDIKMPVMDGLEMLQKLYDEKQELHAILLTGYSDFEYARRALKLQVVDYILKPIELEEFLEVLKKVESKINRSRIQKVTVNQLLENYLEGQEDVYPLLTERMHVGERTEISIFLLSPGSIARETAPELMRQTQELMDAICMENFFLVSMPREHHFMVIVTGTERNRFLRQIFAMKVLKALDETSRCICVYSRIPGLHGLREELLAMKDMLKYGFSLEEGTIIDRELIKTVEYTPISYPEPLEQSICRELRNGNTEKVRSLGEQFISAVIESQADPAQVKEYVLRFAAGIIRVAVDVREQISENQDIRYVLETIAKCETGKEVRYHFEKILHAVTDDGESSDMTENGMILNAISYIRENYGKDITLTDMAKRSGVTPEYLSKLFYRETGVNFVSFLQSFRISVAKRMLLSGKYKIYEVSEAVGFHDQKYFVKVFKKLCGVTPSEYKRENNL